VDVIYTSPTQCSSILDILNDDNKSVRLTGSLAWHYARDVASFRRDYRTARRHHHKDFLWLQHLRHLHFFILFT